MPSALLQVSGLILLASADAPASRGILPSVKPLFHPRLVNEPFGDPGLSIDFLFERRALRFELGDLTPLPALPLLRWPHSFLSPPHIHTFPRSDTLPRHPPARAY